MKELADRVIRGEKRAIARAISWMEDQASAKIDLLKELHPHTGNAYVVGITGSPGAGKSSLTDQLLRHLRKNNHRVGVLAVDPTSPFTGGAILGDRVRMVDHSLDPQIFIRSMGTRGSLGGLAAATREAVQVLDAAGFDVILIETVGVGQSELDIMHVADSTVVVLNPTAGDHIQTMKAGIMEIADLFVVNKADVRGADKTVHEVQNMLDLVHDFDFRPPVLKTISVTGEGIADLWEQCLTHRQFLVDSGIWQKHRQERNRTETVEMILQKITQHVRDLLSQESLQSLDRNPYERAEEIWKRITKT